MSDALATALAGRAALVVAGAGDTVAALRSTAREAELVLLVLGPEVAPLDRAMLLAAIGPLAVELAPARRIAALDLAEDAHPDDVAAAAMFLCDARSSTGQTLCVTPR